MVVSLLRVCVYYLCYDVECQTRRFALRESHPNTDYEEAILSLAFYWQDWLPQICASGLPILLDKDTTIHVGASELNDGVKCHNRNNAKCKQGAGLDH